MSNIVCSLHILLRALVHGYMRFCKSLRIEFLDRLRDELHFETIDELIAQLNADRERVRELTIDN